MNAATPSPIRIDRLRRTVAGLARAIDFYRGALGFVPIEASADRALLQLGEQRIELVRHAGPLPLLPGAVAPDTRFQHAAIVAGDIEAAWRRAESHGAVAISRGGPQTLPASTGGVTAWKFRDPDGHPLELIHFPAGVGDPRWQVEGSGPTLGIDHFALAVASVGSSAAFFAERLGLRVADRGVNRGIEQDRLDGLDGVEVDVVTLAPVNGPGTPHLELLGYRRPVASQPHDPRECERSARDAIVLGGRPDAAATGPRRLDDPDGHVFETGG